MLPRVWKIGGSNYWHHHNVFEYSLFSSYSLNISHLALNNNYSLILFISGSFFLATGDQRPLQTNYCELWEVAICYLHPGNVKFSVHQVLICSCRCVFDSILTTCRTPFVGINPCRIALGPFNTHRVSSDCIENLLFFYVQTWIQEFNAIFCSFIGMWKRWPQSILRPYKTSKIALNTYKYMFP